jgi:hypothetical protein
MRLGRVEVPPQAAAKALGKIAVNFLSMEWQEKAKGEVQQSTSWEHQENLPGMETPEDEAWCYKVSTRSTRNKDRVEEKKKRK